MSEIKFEKIEPYGFWKQVDPTPIEYTEEYERKQSTTKEMSWLRLGTFFSSTEALIKDKYRDYNNWLVCDIGSGNGTFVREASKVFGKVHGYDLVGPSISKEELHNIHWNAVFLTDVLEHFPDINDLFKIKTDIVFLSFPECPEVADWRELRTWRHYKPNEHLWMLNSKGVRAWLRDNDYYCMTLPGIHVEDVIRRNPGVLHNISTVIGWHRDSCDRLIKKLDHML